MKIAPIIHTRTYSCDFNSEFRVRPSVFLNRDVKWARSLVLEATNSIDSLQGERWLIADNGKYRMAGVVGFLKNICDKCSLSEEQKKASEELFYDDKGRLVYAFIGIVIDLTDVGNISNITYDYLWHTYLNIVQPIWKRTYQEVITTTFEDIVADVNGNKPEIKSDKVGQMEMYEANPIMDYNLFEYYLINKSINNFSFCSNIIDINAVKQCNFSIITTSSNIITRLKRKNITESINKNTPDYSNESHEGLEKSKKKSFLVCGICLMIFVIIILILLLLMVNSSQGSL